MPEAQEPSTTPEERIWASVIIAEEVRKSSRPSGGTDLVGAGAKSYVAVGLEIRIDFTIYISIFFEQARLGTHAIDLVIKEPSGEILQTQEVGELNVTRLGQTYVKIVDMRNIRAPLGLSLFLVRVDGRQVGAIPIDVRMPAN